ncbi:MAG: HaeIII family restriction endonuclease [Opitutae bacterium]|nr:HaeIII family restriction endonuclease [Opitutae bacterium]
MSTSSNDQGRAYEYAWINSLCKELSKVVETEIVANSSLNANKRAWDSVDEHDKDLFIASSDSAVKTIIELEPCMVENNGGKLLLEFQKDAAGKQGDVRDILISRKNMQWEIGLSIKHNHEAVKHSRLSHKLDFINEWLGMSCSEEYWNKVRPIFDKLKELKNEKKKWAELNDEKVDCENSNYKDLKIYRPLLQAFIEEIERVCRQNDSTPRKLIEYLIGTNDYYKVVSCDKENLTLIHSFNIHGTLNKPSTVKVSAIRVPIVQLPTELILLKFKPGSNNTVEMYLNNGWQLSFRIHNASTYVEPSLKFDIQFISMPLCVLNLVCKWEK